MIYDICYILYTIYYVKFSISYFTCYLKIVISSNEQILQQVSSEPELAISTYHHVTIIGNESVLSCIVIKEMKKKKKKKKEKPDKSPKRSATTITDLPRFYSFYFLFLNTRYTYTTPVTCTFAYNHSHWYLTTYIIMYQLE